MTQAFEQARMGIMTAPLPLAMPSGNALSSIAALVGDPARTQMLLALMDGKALTAGELACQAGITAQTASGHLAKLVDHGLLSVEKQGRHRYFQFSTPDVARILEELMALSHHSPRRYRPPGPRDKALRLARRCYDHLAGRLGVILADAMVTKGYVMIEDGTASVTPAGHGFLCEFGLSLEGEGLRRPLCRTCLDWSERRPHLAGRLGAALLDHMIALGWLAEGHERRALRLTRKGEEGFERMFGCRISGEAEA